MPLYRLIYTSFRKHTCDDSAIERILEACEKNNPGHGLTGVLLHSEHRFIQYIEGDAVELAVLYDKIKEDDRHTGVNQRSFAPIKNRLFPAWHMGYKDISKDKIGFNTNVSEVDQNTFQEIITGEGVIDERGLSIFKRYFELI